MAGLRQREPLQRDLLPPQAVGARVYEPNQYLHNTRDRCPRTVRTLTQSTGRPIRGRARSPEPADEPASPNMYRAAANLAAYPYFSVIERDRRWETARALMDRARIDYVIAPPSVGSTSSVGAAARYLSHVGGGAAEVSLLFPRRGEPIAIARDAGAWITAQPWCTDLREAAPSHSAAMIRALAELGPSVHRIGVVGLYSDRRSLGSARFAFVQALASAFPSLELIDVTREVAQMRRPKSAEEVAFLDRSTHIAHVMAERFANEIGKDEDDIRIRRAVVETACGLGSELPVGLRWRDCAMAGAARESHRGADPSIHLVQGVFDGAWGGYRARSRRVIQMRGSTASDPAPVALLRDLWDSVFAQARPGVTIQQLDRRARETFASQHQRVVDSLSAIVSIRGCGLGEDAPSPDRGMEDPDRRDLALEPGDCITLTVSIATTAIRAAWADPIVITDAGARLLGRGASS